MAIFDKILSGERQESDQTTGQQTNNLVEKYNLAKKTIFFR